MTWLRLIADLALGNFFSVCGSMCKALRLISKDVPDVKDRLSSAGIDDCVSFRFGRILLIDDTIGSMRRLLASEHSETLSQDDSPELV